MAGCEFLGLTNRSKELRVFADETRAAAEVARQEALDWRQRSEEAWANEQSQLALAAEANAKLSTDVAAFLEERAATALDDAADAADGDILGAVKQIATFLPPQFSVPILTATTIFGGLFGAKQNGRANIQTHRANKFAKATSQIVTGLTPRNGSDGLTSALKDSLRETLDSESKGVIFEMRSMLAQAKAS